jgi:hypothetical protein
MPKRWTEVLCNRESYCECNDLNRIVIYKWHAKPSNLTLNHKLRLLKENEIALAILRRVRVFDMTYGYENEREWKQARKENENGI